MSEISAVYFSGEGESPPRTFSPTSFSEATEFRALTLPLDSSSVEVPQPFVQETHASLVENSESAVCDPLLRTPSIAHKVKHLAGTLIGSGFASPSISGRLLVDQDEKGRRNLNSRVFHETKSWSRLVQPRVDSRWVSPTPLEQRLGEDSPPLGPGTLVPPLSLEGESWEAVSELFVKESLTLKSLRSLTLTDCGLTPAHLAQFPCLPSLVYLNLSDNPLEGLGEFFFKDVIPTMNSINSATQSTSGNCATCPLPWLSFAPNVQELRLRGCKLNFTPSFLGLAVMPGRGLTHLDLSCNFISHTEALAPLAPSLRFLDLSCNNLCCLHAALRPLSVLNHLQHLICHPNPLTLYPAASLSSDSRTPIHSDIHYRATMIDIMPALSFLDGLPTPPSSQQKALARVLEEKEQAAQTASLRAAAAARRAARPYGSRSLTDVLHLPLSAAGTLTRTTSQYNKTIAAPVGKSLSSFLSPLPRASNKATNPSTKFVGRNVESPLSHPFMPSIPMTGISSRLLALSKPIVRPDPPPRGADASQEEARILEEQRTREEEAKKKRSSGHRNKPSWCWMTVQEPIHSSHHDFLSSMSVREIIASELAAATSGYLSSPKESLAEDSVGGAHVVDSVAVNDTVERSQGIERKSAYQQDIHFSHSPTLPMLQGHAGGFEYSEKNGNISVNVQPPAPASSLTPTAEPNQEMGPHTVLRSPLQTPSSSPHYQQLKNRIMRLLVSLKSLLNGSNPGKGVSDLSSLAINAEIFARDVKRALESLESGGLVKAGGLGRLTHLFRLGSGSEGIPHSGDLIQLTDCGIVDELVEDLEGDFELEGYLILEGMGKDATQALLCRVRILTLALYRFGFLALAHADSVRRVLMQRASEKNVRVNEAGEVTALVDSVEAAIENLKRDLSVSPVGVLLSSLQ